MSDEFLRFLAKKLYESSGKSQNIGYFTGEFYGEYEFNSLSEDSIFNLLKKASQEFSNLSLI